MPTISGKLKLVTDKPALVSEVWVRSSVVRPYGGGVLTAFNDTVPVTNGEVSFTAVPGAAVLVLVQLGGPQVAVPIIVEESPARQTLYQVIKNAEMVEGRTADELAAIVSAINDTLKSADSVAAQIAADAKAADAAARNARGGESGARAAESGAAKSASAAAESAKSAAALEEGAQGAQAAAAESAKSAGVSEENARSYAATAAQHEVAASGHADTAKREADRTATIAGSTRWVGTRLEVNGKLSPDLKGEKGEKGDKGDPGRDGTVSFESLSAVQREEIRGPEGAPGPPGEHGPEGPRGPQGNPGPAGPDGPAGPKGDKGDTGPAGTTKWAGITDKPTSYPTTSADVTDASNDIGAGKGGKLVKGRDGDGKIFTYTPVDQVTNPMELVAKGYVDSVAENLASKTDLGVLEARVAQTVQVETVTQLPPSPTPGVFYVVTRDKPREVHLGVGGGRTIVMWRVKPIEVVPPEPGQGWIVNALQRYGQTAREVTELPFDLDTSQVTDMSYMFYNCSSLTTVPFDLDTSQVTNMRSMFYNCSSLTTVPEMDTSQVTDMSYMFYNCSSLTTVPFDLDTSQATDMAYMFYYCSSLTTVPFDLDTSQATDMAYMFYNCSSLTDGSVRLIRKNRTKPYSRSSMISGSKLTREPFFDAAGNPF